MVFLTHSLILLLLFTVPTQASEPEVNAPVIDKLILKERPQPHWITLDASIEAVKAATVSAQTSGRIIKLYYDVNDTVPEGAPLLQITDKEQGAVLAAAEADYAKAKALDIEAQAQLTRYQALFPQGAISRGAMDEAIARAKSSEQAVSVAKAQIIKARESLKYTLVAAPFGGIVTARHVELGETVSPGQPLMSGYDPGQLRAVAQVPARYLEALRQQGSIRLQLDDAGEELTVARKDISLFDFADPLSHSHAVRVKLDNQDGRIQPGSWAKLSFIGNLRPQILVPVSALIIRGELQAVYLKQGKDFVLTQVKLGKQQGDRVEILSGLRSADEIALDAMQGLTQKFSR
jgi:membrane fusion protein, multidrug efflux system